MYAPRETSVTLARAARLATTILLAAAVARPALAQTPAPRAALASVAGVARPVAPLSGADREAMAREAGASTGRGARVAKYTGVGALMGAVVGIVAARMILSDPNITDHSEDGYTYMLYVPAGALIGAGAGALIGLMATSDEQRLTTHHPPTSPR